MSGYTTLASCQSGCLLRLQLDFSENISLSLPQKVSLVLHLAKSLKEYKFVKTFFFRISARCRYELRHHCFAEKSQFTR